MSYVPPEVRDAKLGAALRELHVPEHAPDFPASLRARLDAVQPEHRRSNVIPFPSPGLPQVTLAAAAVAAVAALVFFFGFQGADLRNVGSERATAAQITARMAAQVASTQTIAGVLTIRNRQGTAPIHTDRWEFLSDARGNVRVTDLPDRTTLLYRARTGEEFSYEQSSDAYGLSRGLAPGLPDQGPSESFLQRDLGSVVRALAARGGIPVEEGEYRGRPVWILRTRASLRLVVPEEPTDRIEVTVDRRTAFPVRIVETLRGRFVSEIRLDRLRIDEPLPPRAFEPSIGPGSRADVSDVGFRRTALSDAERVVGYIPLSPGSLPDGYRRAETVTAIETDPTAYGRNPVSRDVVSTAYRRGLDRVIVTTRALGSDPASWSDPLALNENVRVRSTPLSFSGFRGHLVVTPGLVPHVWGLDDRLVVTVSGDLTRAELVRVARSLRPLR